MRVVILACGILVEALWFAALTPARAAVPFEGGMIAAASALSDTTRGKEEGRPWLVGPTSIVRRDTGRRGGAKSGYSALRENLLILGRLRGAGDVTVYTSEHCTAARF